MTLKVQVTWVNGGSTLLPEALASIVLTTNGGAATLTRKAVGVREFDVPDGATTLSIAGSFSVRFPAVAIAATPNDPARTEPERDDEVWAAEQTYTVAQGVLTPKDIPAYVHGHPLIEAIVATGVNAAVQIRLRTEFVDVTSFWMAYAEPTHVLEWQREHDPDVNLLALGYTGGKPLVWFASIPKACAAPAQGGVSCLAFFRPANDGFTQLNQGQNMFRLDRFLLKPRQSPIYWKRDVFSYKDAAQTQEFLFLRCGMEDALNNSTKPVVLLQPWPNGLEFADAGGTKLPDLAAAAIRFLWAKQELGKNLGGVHLRGLGLAGFSAGGLAMWPALLANEDRVDEVYAFDAAGFDAGRVVQWFNKKPQSRCLRMTGAHHIARYQAILQAIVASTGATQRVTAFPASSAAYTTAGTIPRWDHVLTGLLPADQTTERADVDAWHQYAMFGSSTTLIDTFLELFLDKSNF